MEKDVSAQAGESPAGKQEDLDKLSVRARAAKLSHELKKKRLEQAAIGNNEDAVKSDEFVSETLMRFGIQI